MGNSQPKPTIDEQLREHIRMIDRATRELLRERQRLESEEKKRMQEIKSSAAKGEIGAAKIMAKDLLVTRRYIQKFYQMHSQLQAVKLRIQTVKSTQAMAQSMRGVTQVMVKMNQQMDVPIIRNILKEFVKQSDKLEATEELMSNAIEDVVGEEDDELEGDQCVARILEEIGVDLSGQLAAAPVVGVGVKGTTEAAVTKEAVAADKSLEDRLQNLRK